MKTSKFFYIKVLAVLLLLVAIVYGATATPTPTTEATTATATPTSTTEATTATATPTPTPTTTNDEPGSLHYEETVRFNNVDLIKKDIPEWLIDAIEKDDPVVVARTIAERVTRANLEDFGVRTIYGKDPIGFYCWNDGYIKKEGDKILIGDEVYVYLDEPTVPLIIPEEKKFGFVETLINFLWKRDCKCFWTAGYEHFIEVKEVPFPIEKEPAICVDGEFLSLMPTTMSALEVTDAAVSYASDYSERSEIWFENSGIFYCIDSYTFMLQKWEWSPSQYIDKRWQRTGEVPTIQDFVISAAWGGNGFWYLTKDSNTVTVFEPWEAPETTGKFGIKPIISIKFDGVNIVRPFVDYEGAESITKAYVATPETNTLWKITPWGIATCQLSQIEILNDEIYAKNGEKVEKVATKASDVWLGSWSGRFVKMLGELEFSNVLEFESLERSDLAPGVTMESRDGKIVFVAEGATVTIE